MADRAPQRWFVLVGIALAVLTGGIVLFANRNRIFGSDQVPDSPELATYWYCANCQRGFSLNPREYEGGLGVQPASDESSAGGKPMRTRMTVICPACGQTAVSARSCSKDGTIFDPQSVNGKAGICPSCGASAPAK